MAGTLTEAARRRLGPLRERLRGGGSAPRPPLPGGSFDEPADGSEVPRWFVRVRGWAMTPDGPVDRVELSLDGEVVALARLCTPRPDVFMTLAAGEHAILSGFEHTLDLTGIPLDREHVELRATAFGSRGERVDLGAARITLVPAEDEPFEDEDGRVPLLHERSLQPVVPHPAPPADKPLNVLVVTHDLNLGGGQLVLLQQLQRFAAAGMTGAVIAPRDGATRQAIEDAGFPVHITGHYPLDDFESYEGRLAELVAWAAPQGFDVVLVNTMVAFVGGDLADRLGLAAVWVVHESYGLDGFWATYPERWLHPHVRDHGVASFQQAAGIIFEVDATRRLFEPLCPGT